MEIVIEIGNDEERRLITNELEILRGAVKAMKLEDEIEKIIVVSDLEETINRLENRMDYRQTRGVGDNVVTTQARVHYDDEKATIILSPNIYTHVFDSQFRFFIVLHELGHVYTRKEFPKLDSENNAKNIYLGNLYRIYDEYFCDRLALVLVNGIFKVDSDYFKAMIQSILENEPSNLNSVEYIGLIREQIEIFRNFQQDVDSFLDKTKIVVDIVPFITMHYYTILHHYPNAAPPASFYDSPFINEKTEALVNYFKKKYEEKNMDLSDGIGILADYFTNFGFRFEDREMGLYVNIVDI